MYICDFILLSLRTLWNFMHYAYALTRQDTEFSESLAARDASSSKFPKIVKNQKIPILAYCLIYSSYQLHTLVYYTRPCPTVM